MLDTSRLGPGTWKFTGSGHQKEHPLEFRISGQEGYKFLFTAYELDMLQPSGSAGFHLTPLISTVGEINCGVVAKTIKVGGKLTFIGDAKPGVYTGTMYMDACYI